MEGQLNQQERSIITNWVIELKPERTLELDPDVLAQTLATRASRTVVDCTPGKSN